MGKNIRGQENTMSSGRQIQIGLVQMRCGSDPHKNLEHAAEQVKQAAQQGANVVCLPELFRTQYFCQSEDYANFDLAEPVPGPSTDLLSRLARQHGVVILAGLFERRAAGVYHNTVAVLDADGQFLGKYRKMHIPDDPLYFEKFYFTPGDLGFKVFPSQFGQIGTLVCWDQWFPEAARLTALQGAEILFYPTAIGWHPSEKEEFGATQHANWELIQRSHAIANGCFVVAVNRTGHEGAANGGVEFWGQSFVADPNGTILSRAPVAEEATIVACVNLDLVEVVRTHWPFLRDRRVDAYGGLMGVMNDE